MIDRIDFLQHEALKRGLFFDDLSARTKLVPFPIIAKIGLYGVLLPGFRAVATPVPLTVKVADGVVPPPVLLAGTVTVPL